MLTVNYEQYIGRRVAGQDCREFSDVTITRGPDTSQTDKWRYWRCGLADGSAVSVNIYEKAPGKSALSVEHSKLESDAQVEHWRAWWKGVLKGGINDIAYSDTYSRVSQI